MLRRFAMDMFEKFCMGTAALSTLVLLSAVLALLMN
jgi:hypothetical protein